MEASLRKLMETPFMKTYTAFLNDKISPLFAGLWPYLFIAQCCYTISLFRQHYSHVKSFFLCFLTIVLGPTLVSLLLVKETPGWLNNENFFLAFAACWVVLHLGGDYIVRPLQRIVFHFNAMAVSHIVINNLARVMNAKKEWKAPLLVMLFTAYLSGMSSTELALGLARDSSRRRERAMLGAVTMTTLLAYVAFTAPHLIFSRVPEAWLALLPEPFTQLAAPQPEPLMPLDAIRKSVPWLAASVAVFVDVLTSCIVKPEAAPAESAQPGRRAARTQRARAGAKSRRSPSPAAEESAEEPAAASSSSTTAAAAPAAGSRKKRGSA